MKLIGVLIISIMLSSLCYSSNDDLDDHVDIFIHNVMGKYLIVGINAEAQIHDYTKEYATNIFTAGETATIVIHSQLLHEVDEFINEMIDLDFEYLNIKKSLADKTFSIMR